MPVLGMAVFGGACALIGGGLAYWWDHGTIDQLEREVQQSNAIIRRFERGAERRNQLGRCR
jgi:hypothetical protein